MTLKGLLGLGLLAGSSLAWSAPPAVVTASPPTTVVSTPSGCTAAQAARIPKTPYFLCLVTRRGWLHYKVYDSQSGAFSAEVPLEKGLILGLLASTRAEPLWPELIEFTGEDGGKLRSALRRRAEQVLRPGLASPRDSVSSEHYVSGSVLKVMQAAEFYSQAGDVRAARALLVGKRKELEAAGLKSYDQQFSWVALQLREARIEALHGRPDAAIAIYENIAANDLVPIDIRSNGAMNHAALMAETGHPREALALLDQVEPIVMGSGDQVEGSNRQFAWIRACALHHLGDRKGTKKAMAVLKSAPADLRQASGSLMSTESLELRMGYCMGDDEFLAQVLRAGSDYLIDPNVLSMQAGFISVVAGHDETNRRLAARFAKAGYRPAVRQLPAGLIPALNNWTVRFDLPAPEAAPAAVGRRG